MALYDTTLVFYAAKAVRATERQHVSVFLAGGRLARGQVGSTLYTKLQYFFVSRC